MNKVEDLSVRRAEGLRATVEQVVAALVELGGSAHRDLIATRVDSYRQSTTARASEHTLAEVEQALLAYEDDGGRKDRALFRRVFGPASHRWTLKGDRAPEPSLEAAGRL